MIAKATREGLAALRRHPRLAVALWLLNLALALAAGVPGFLALRSAISLLPEADALANGFSMGVLVDLVEMRPGLLGGLALSALGVAFLGLLAGAAATGGALEVLMSEDDDRPFGHRFGRGAGRFFLRFLRAGLLAGLAGALGAALLGGPLLGLGARLRRESGSEALSHLVSLSGFALAGLAGALGAALLGGPLLGLGARLRRESGSEALSHLVSLSGFALAGLAFLLALLALDAARVRIVREDARRVLPMLRSGFAVVLGHPLKWLGTWGVNALLGLLALALYLLFRNVVPAGTVPLVLLMVAAQQAFVLVRSGLRVVLLGSEIVLVERLRPRPAPVVAPPQPEDEPVAAPALSS